MRYRTIEIDGIKIFYREVGHPDAPKLLLLHGFPASSHQYRNLLPALADKFHVIAPDYPGFGYSDMPDPSSYTYSFDNTARLIEKFLQKLGFTRFGLYVQDYGGPVGFRIVGRHPDWLEWLVIQNTNAFEIGFTKVWDSLRSSYWRNRNPETEAAIGAFLEPPTVRAVYTTGHPNPELVSPDNWNMDDHLLERPGAKRGTAGLLLRLPDERRTVSCLAGLPQTASAEDGHLLGSGRHLLHACRWRGFPWICSRKRKSTGYSPDTSRSKTAWRRSLVR